METIREYIERIYKNASYKKAENGEVYAVCLIVTNVGIPKCLVTPTSCAQQ